MGFKENHFDIQQEATDDSARVVKVSEPFERKVEAFNFRNIKPESTRSSVPAPAQPAKPSAPASVRSSAPASVRTNAHPGGRDSRFQLSDLARNALGINHDEERLIQARVTELVQAELARVRAEVERKGYEDGAKQGREAAVAELRETSKEKLAAIESMVQEMEKAKMAAFEANERMLIELIYRIAGTVTLHELATDRAYLTRLSKELIERVGLRENIAIKINPDAAAALEEIREGIVQSLGSLRNLSVEVSPKVKGGGVILETEWGVIDASIETQLKSIRDALQSPPQAKAGS